VFRFLEMIKLALRSLSLHKMRSGLTGLGIIFGVGAVVSMLSIGEGARWEALNQLKLLGTDTIIVRSVKPPVSVTPDTEQSWVIDYGLTFADADHLESVCPGIEVLAIVRDCRKDIWYRGKRVDGRAFGVTPVYQQAGKAELERGRFIAELDMEKFDKVCVIGDSIKRQLFPYRDPRGEGLRIGGKEFTIIGVVASRGAAGGGSLLAGRDVNRDIYMPLSTALKRFGTLSYQMGSGSAEGAKIEADEFLIKLSDSELVESSAKVIRTILERRHPDPDYEIVIPQELLRQSQRTQNIFNVVMGSIAGISLLVGGIGIMNIMLATVTERTRDIGIRRAIGATRVDIVLQFLIETVVLSCIGGGTGVFLGVAGARMVSAAADWKTIVTAWSVITAFAISALVGIIFGLYPAWKAANLDPIEALRYE